MAVEAVARKWGNSIGIVFPKDFVEKAHLKPNDKVVIEVIKAVDLSNIFGSLKTKGKRMSGQEFKDMVKEGWF